eukprot:4225527-Pyramimonas_sp.AAC.1
MQDQLMSWFQNGAATSEPPVSPDWWKQRGTYEVPGLAPPVALRRVAAGFKGRACQPDGHHPRHVGFACGESLE